MFSLNNNSVEVNKNEENKEKIDDSLNINFKTNRSFAPFQINHEKDKGRNKNEKFDKEIYYSKTESNNDLNKKNRIIKMTKDKNKSDFFYASHKMKIANFINNQNKFQNFEQKNARNLKLSDLNRYMNNVHNINIYNKKIKINEPKPKNMSLNHYFELNKINQAKKSVNNIYNDINIYHKSFVERKKENNFRNKKNNLYSETERFINNKINFNMYENNKNSEIEQKEKKLLKLEKILEELKLNQKEIQNELYNITKENSELEKNQAVKNKNIYINIKNILENASMEDLKSNKNLNSKLYKSLSNKEKCKYLRKIYLEKKLQKSLIDKINSLYVNSYNTINEADINSGNEYDLNNLLNWVISLVENIDYLNMQNNKLKFEINEKTKEKDKYKTYYGNWAKIFCAKTKDEIIQNINELIKEQNINNNEKIKMIKMLFNNKNHS